MSASRAAEIGRAAKPAWRQGAKVTTKPSECALLVAKISARSNAVPVRRMAKNSTKTTTASPFAIPIQAGGNAAPALLTARIIAKTTTSAPSAADPIHPPGNGAGASMPTKTPSKTIDRAPASIDIAEIVTDIVRNQRLRKFAIKSQSRCDRSVESLIATIIGYDSDADEKNRKAVFAKARAFRVAVEGGKGQCVDETQSTGALPAVIPAILANSGARAPWDDLRDKCEKEMERLATFLPIWSFVKGGGVRGLGAMGLAVIVAEAGIPIGDYRTVSGLWKRLGLAVINGRAQRRVSGEAAVEQGYSPARRAQVWAVCSDSLFRAQWRGAKDEDGKDPAKTGKPVAIPAHPIGPYGEIYARRREATGTRDPAEWPKGRCHNDARRVMTKALMLDLWLVWRGLPPLH